MCSCVGGGDAERMTYTDVACVYVCCCILKRCESATCCDSCSLIGDASKTV